MKMMTAVLIVLVLAALLWWAGYAFPSKGSKYEYFQKGTIEVSVVDEGGENVEGFELFTLWPPTYKDAEGFWHEYPADVIAKDFPCGGSGEPLALGFYNKNHDVEGHSIQAEEAYGRNAGLTPDGIAFPIEFIVRVKAQDGYESMKIQVSEDGKTSIAGACPAANYAISSSNFTAADAGRSTDKVFNSLLGSFTLDLTLQKQATP